MSSLERIPVSAAAANSAALNTVKVRSSTCWVVSGMVQGIWPASSARWTSGARRPHRGATPTCATADSAASRHWRMPAAGNCSAPRSWASSRKPTRSSGSSGSIRLLGGPGQSARPARAAVRLARHSGPAVRCTRRRRAVRFARLCRWAVSSWPGPQRGDRWFPRGRGRAQRWPHHAVGDRRCLVLAGPVASATWVAVLPAQGMKPAG